MLGTSILKNLQSKLENLWWTDTCCGSLLILWGSQHWGDSIVVSRTVCLHQYSNQPSVLYFSLQKTTCIEAHLDLDFICPQAEIQFHQLYIHKTSDTVCNSMHIRKKVLYPRYGSLYHVLDTVRTDTKTEAMSLRSNINCSFKFRGQFLPKASPFKFVFVICFLRGLVWHWLSGHVVSSSIEITTCAVDPLFISGSKMLELVYVKIRGNRANGSLALEYVFMVPQLCPANCIVPAAYIKK